MAFEEKQRLAKKILISMYANKYVETLYNTKNEQHQKNGWELKSGIWSPWYFNMRPVGASPEIVADISSAMNRLIMEEIPEVKQIVGVEMAGVPLASAISVAKGQDCKLIPYSYTRPLPGIKARTPEEAKKALSDFKEVSSYGGKDLVEGRFNDGESICIVDDMITNAGSKLIAKAIIEHELESRKVNNVSINHVAVVLDREQGGEQELQQQNMQLHALIKFKTYGLEWLKNSMHPEEYKLISDYQTNPQKYQNKEMQAKAIEKATQIRAGK